MNQALLPGFERPPVTRCRICNRPLKNPISISAGIGPVCSGRQYSRLILMPSLLRQEHSSDYVEMLNMAADEIERLQQVIKTKSRRSAQ
jgi:hypothetical protein